MTHISKKKIDEEILERLFIQLASVVRNAGRNELEESFTNDFFTASEMVMFAKRLAGMVFLAKGIPQHVICDRLGMSPSTISIISRGIKMGKYDAILEITENSNNQLFETLLGFVLANLPRPFGRHNSGYFSIYRDGPKFNKSYTKSKKIRRNK